MRLIGDISRLNARRYPDKPALIFGDEVLSFSSMDALSNRIANGLIDAGIKPGDRVAILSENCLEYFPVSFGIAKIGAVTVTLNYRSSENELNYMIADCGASAIFCAPNFLPLARKHGNTSAVHRHIYDMSALTNGGDTDNEDVFARTSATEPGVEIDEQSAFGIFYTSGTTGRPKGVVLSHRSVLISAQQIAMGTGVRTQDRVLVSVPLFHGGGLTVLGHAHLYMGATLVITQKFDAEQCLRVMERYAVTTFFGVGAQYALLLDLPDERKHHLGDLRRAWYGAAPMPVELVRRVQDMWPGAELIQLYGQTETTLISILDADGHRNKIGTAGRELPGVEMRVVDPAGRDVSVDAVGEVIVGQHCGMTGYFGDPEQTAETIRDGWIMTGDLARMDADGYITLVDRKRDVIISGGENIYPKEIEEVIHTNPDVLVAAVIGIADPKWGETPYAFVVPCSGKVLDQAALAETCVKDLARYKVPRHWQIVDQLPQTANGKVQKHILREWVTRGRFSTEMSDET